MTVDLCLSPALYPLYHSDDKVVVVTDIFRATTTIVTAFHNGARSIRPVATVDEAQQAKEAGMLVGAERNVQRCDFADFGNSPFDYSSSKVYQQDIVFTTTNGTKAVVAARKAFAIAAGAFVNISAVAEWCVRHGRNVNVLASAWEDRPNLEDTLFGGALISALIPCGFRTASDAAQMALDLWRLHRHNLKSSVMQCEHYARLRANGLEDSVDYCLSRDLAPVVPEVRDGIFVC
ncbi:MAG: 2-phosphosulfolactate phosphatase [Tannerellaceae bacterium]|jgi:2-phosphosulfolactate phosphatase|nr:2-phosphosulfolactate phosphatase [Tannerellaceae bacterium]